MSNFPQGGDIQATRAWLDSEGFTGMFVNWKADALLGKSEDFIKNKFPDEPERGEILCGYLSLARTLGK